MIPHWMFILFLFMLGACIGSFLNVVVWRLPRNISLMWPPSACPKCSHRLSWRDNVPVFGWIFLRGKCRYCHEPVSSRYPIIEAITGLLFAGYYVAIFLYGMGPVIVTYDSFGVPEYIALNSLEQDWAIFALLMLLVCGLLAASLIDAELYIIPIEIPWVIAGIAFIVHTFAGGPYRPGFLSAGPLPAGFAIAACVGLVISMTLLWLKVLPRSFPEGEPILDWERKAMEEQLAAAGASEKEIKELPPVATPKEIRGQMMLEAAFVAIPAILAFAALLSLLWLPDLRKWWTEVLSDHTWLAGLLGSVFGAMIAASLIWVTRILATLALGRVAMGQGDTHLMVAIGAVLGAGPALVVFFLAPLCGVVIGIYQWLSKGARELPYGPYLSLAAAAVILLYRYVDEYFRPHVEILGDLLWQWLAR